MNICEKAYTKKEKHDRLYCKISESLCAHQYWCDMALRWKNTGQAENCPGKNPPEKSKKRVKKEDRHE